MTTKSKCKTTRLWLVDVLEPSQMREGWGTRHATSWGFFSSPDVPKPPPYLTPLQHDELRLCADAPPASPQCRPYRSHTTPTDAGVYGLSQQQLLVRPATRPPTPPEFHPRFYPMPPRGDCARRLWVRLFDRESERPYFSASPR
jgi:hypothetical protein